MLHVHADAWWTKQQTTLGSTPEAKQAKLRHTFDTSDTRPLQQAGEHANLTKA